MTRLILGDCLEMLKTLPDSSVDAVVTDPPAGIAFMGKDWDRDKGGRRQWIDWLSSVLAECLRVARPGSVLLCWAIPRTSHWTGTAIEDAGWQIQDRLAHVFGSGFPKHHSHLKPAVEDWWLARKPGPKWLGVEANRVSGGESRRINTNPGIKGNNFANNRYESMSHETRSTTEGRWPANLLLSHSPLCVRRGTKAVASNGHYPKARGKSGYSGGWEGQAGLAERHTAGETVADWECVEGCPIRLMGEQGGERKSGKPCGKRRANNVHCYGDDRGRHGSDLSGFGDSGSAARFFPNFDAEPYDPLFYCPKASRKDRNAGCEGMEAKRGDLFGDDPYTVRRNGDGRMTNGDGTVTPQANHHPTVKPTELMRWLCRLACPPGGTILDPFLGSGSTGRGAVLEGFGFVGIEREEEYLRIAEARLADARADHPLFAGVAS